MRLIWLPLRSIQFLLGTAFRIDSEEIIRLTLRFHCRANATDTTIGTIVLQAVSAVLVAMYVARVRRQDGNRRACAVIDDDVERVAVCLQHVNILHCQHLSERLLICAFNPRMDCIRSESEET